tara:strand:+ start:96 stop:302 length:207 start_codon:yes stop_codon:yes gene_type:complete
MSRKHYIKVAKIIKDSTLLYKYRDSNDGRKMLPTINKTLLVSELCTMFKADNNNFDVVRFIDACGDDE